MSENPNDEHSILLRELARRSGVLDVYFDLWNKPHEADQDTLSAILAAMGFSVGDAESLRRSLALLEREETEGAIDVVAVVPAEGPQIIRLRRPAENVRLSMFGEPVPVEPCALENGALALRLAKPLPSGVHDLNFADDTDNPRRLTLIVAPKTGHRPSSLDQGKRLWGINLPLYCVRSATDWGVGDFGDLADIVRWAANLGADIVGLLPLHALFDEPPLGISPYYPSSRLFLNPVYINVAQTREAASPEVAAFLEHEETRKRIAGLRETPLVDYAGVWALKRQALRLCFDVFRQDALSRQRFEKWRSRSGEALTEFSTYCALREHLTNPEGYATHWRDWPEAYRRPDTGAVRRFAEKHADEVTFHAWVQWVADEQLGRAAEAANQAGMEVGLYLDMALGVDPGGADAWSHQDVLALGASSGCPPDPFSLLGQKWGLPPAVPRLHRNSGYRFVRQTIGRNAYHAGAVRIDHAAALARLYWIPGDMPAKTGAYVADRLEEELALLRALSASEECSIVGEDLGTVPQEVRDGLEESGFFSYRLLMFEKEWDGRFKTPGNFPRNALISFGTHDLPTLDGWWSGRDLEVKRSLARYPDEEAELGERQGRENDRLQLVAALREQGFLSKGEEPDMSPGAQPGPGGLDALAAALYAYLAKTPCGLLLVNLDDMLGEIEMQNLPGTLQEHPNWRRRVSLPRERWDEFPRVRKIAEAIQRERG